MRSAVAPCVLWKSFLLVVTLVNDLSQTEKSKSAIDSVTSLIYIRQNPYYSVPYSISFPRSSLVNLVQVYSWISNILYHPNLSVY